ncbi:MAG TPA: response regulator [Flavobacteriales bacterium]|nr:response regulator [Flavobacteriales bacterium]
MNKPQVLVVDDEPQIPNQLRIALESNGLAVQQAATALGGVPMAANHPPELILLDIGLPDRSEQGVLKELRV